MKLFDLLKSDIIKVRTIQGAEDIEISFLQVCTYFFNFRLTPIYLHRISIFFAGHHINFLAKLFSLFNIIFFGMEISTKLKIGPGLFFPHTVGTVLGAARIGKNCTIYQGVTVGAKNIDFVYNEKNRPIIGDNVLIAAGAKILGGITIGNNVIIAANSVVLDSVPDNCIIGGIPAKIIKELT